MQGILMCAKNLLCPHNKHTNLYFQLRRLQIYAREQRSIILLYSRAAGHSPALSWSSRFVAARMMSCSCSWSPCVEISTRYERAHVHVMGKYVVAYQFREKMYQVCKHCTVLRTRIVFCCKQWEKETYIHNYHNTTTKIPIIKCIFLHLSTYYKSPKVPRALKMQTALFFVMPLCDLEAHYQYFKKPYCLWLQGCNGMNYVLRNGGKHLPLSSLKHSNLTQIRTS